MSDVCVDIVVATNRDSPYLTEALESVRAQTHSDWRLFVVDDGSPDPEALERSVTSVIPDAVVVHQANMGPSAARNRGVALGTAPLVTFLDDDDVWRADRLELLVKALSAFPEAVGAHSGAWYMNAEGERIGQYRTLGAAPSEMLRGAIPIPFFVTIMVRRESIECVGGFDPSLRWAEDNDLILRLLRLGRFAAVHENLVGYRRHQDNATNAPWHVTRTVYDGMLRAQIDDAERTGDTETARLLREHYRAFARHRAAETPGVVLAHLHARDLSSAARDLAWAFRHAPLTTVSSTAHAMRRRMGLP